MKVIDGRFSLIESEVDGSYMTVNNFHLQPIYKFTEIDPTPVRRISFQSSTTAATTTTTSISLPTLNAGTSIDGNKNRTENTTILTSTTNQKVGKRKKSPAKPNLSDPTTVLKTNSILHKSDTAVRSSPTTQLQDN
jgi:hypothetical protein